MHQLVSRFFFIVLLVFATSCGITDTDQLQGDNSIHIVVDDSFDFLNEEQKALNSELIPFLTHFQYELEDDNEKDIVLNVIDLNNIKIDSIFLFNNKDTKTLKGLSKGKIKKCKEYYEEYEISDSLKSIENYKIHYKDFISKTKGKYDNFTLICYKGNSYEYCKNDTTVSAINILSIDDYKKHLAEQKSEISQNYIILFRIDFEDLENKPIEKPKYKPKGNNPVGKNSTKSKEREITEKVANRGNKQKEASELNQKLANAQSPKLKALYEKRLEEKNQEINDLKEEIDGLFEEVNHFRKKLGQSELDKSILQTKYDDLQNKIAVGKIEISENQKKLFESEINFNLKDFDNKCNFVDLDGNNKLVFYKINSKTHEKDVISTLTTTSYGSNKYEADRKIIKDAICYYLKNAYNISNTNGLNNKKAEVMSIFDKYINIYNAIDTKTNSPSNLNYSNIEEYFNKGCN